MEKIWWLKSEEQPIRVQLFWIGQKHCQKVGGDVAKAIVGLPDGDVTEVDIAQLRWTEPY